MAKKQSNEIISTDGRYYYKDKQGHPAYNLREPLGNILEDTSDYIQITKEEWDSIQPVIPEPVPPTAEEIHASEVQAEIASLKAFLRETDYIIIKIAELPAEAEAIREEYASVIAERQAKRARINELEASL